MAEFSFEVEAELLAQRRKKEEAQDLYNEVTGLENGRGGRFTNERTVRAEREKDAADDLLQLSLQLQLLNPEYRDAYEFLGEELDRAREASRRARMALEEELAANEARRRMILDQAFRMPDGTAVFLSQDGSQVFDENGHDITAEGAGLSAAATLQNRPRFETFQTVTTEGRVLAMKLEAIDRYDQELEGIEQQRQAGTFSLDELRALGATLRTDAPLSAQDHWADAAPAEAVPGLALLSADELASVTRPAISASTELLGESALPQSIRIAGTFAAAVAASPPEPTLNAPERVPAPTALPPGPAA